MAALSKQELVDLVREMLLLEADEVLEGDRDEIAGDASHEDRRLHVARRLFEMYRTDARREVRKFLRQLPTMGSVVADATFAFTRRRFTTSTLPARRELLAKYADPRMLELARLRQWAVRQLKRTKGAKGTTVDVMVTFVYLSLRDVCDWERKHVEAFGERESLLYAVTGSFADERNESGAAGEWTVLPSWEQ